MNVGLDDEQERRKKKRRKLIFPIPGVDTE